MSDTAELVVSELVTNSLKCIWASEISSPVILRVAADHKYLRIEVWDAVQRAPVQRPHEIDAESGRGLEIISMLCNHWDTFFPDSGGKIVRATIEIDQGKDW